MTGGIPIAVPTYRRYDLLMKLMASVVSGTMRPSKILVIDNGCALRDFMEEHGVALPVEAELHEPGRNLGVATSWNLALRWAGGPVLIVNDDIELAPTSVEAFTRAIRPGVPQFVTPIVETGWACFMQTPEVAERVGFYDERFFPAYFEDDDYARRMELAGLSEEHIDAGAISHVGSATAADFNLIEIDMHNQTFDENEALYVRKWGGLPGQETLVVPRDDDARIADLHGALPLTSR